MQSLVFAQLHRLMILSIMFVLSISEIMHFLLRVLLSELLSVTERFSGREALLKACVCVHICCFPFRWESSASTLWKCQWSPCLFRCVSPCDVCTQVCVCVDGLCWSSLKCLCVCVWCVNVTDQPISSTWLPMLASTCLCAQIFSVGKCILRPEEKTGALCVWGHLTPRNCRTVQRMYAAVTLSHYIGTTKKVRSHAAIILAWCIWH